MLQPLKSVVPSCGNGANTAPSQPRERKSTRRMRKSCSKSRQMSYRQKRPKATSTTLLRSISLDKSLERTMQVSITSTSNSVAVSDLFDRLFDDVALQRDHVRRPSCEVVNKAENRKPLARDSFDQRLDCLSGVRSWFRDGLESVSL